MKKRNIITIVLFLASLILVEKANAYSFSDTLNKAKNEASKAKQNVTKKWQNLDPATQNAIIGVGAATAGTAVAAGLRSAAGYAGYNAYQGKNREIISNDPTQDQATFDQLIHFLSNDSNYAGKPELQKGFINRFDISPEQKQNILDIVQYDEQLAGS